MIYVSSACSQQKKIGDAVAELAEHDFTHIELTGGTQYYPDYEKELLDLRDIYGLHYLVHNYFPPPVDDFVLNLASVDDEIYQRSLVQLKQSLDFCQRFGIDRFGFHAGFFIAPSNSTIGRKMQKQSLPNRDVCLHRFLNAVQKLEEKSGTVALYVENNVYSQENYLVFGESVPFMGIRYDDFIPILSTTNCKVLFDIAHLYVTATTIGFSFPKEMVQFMNQTDYVHLSFNNGVADQNYGITGAFSIYEGLDSCMLQGKIITLEIYEGLDVVRRSKQYMEEWLNG